MPSSCLRPLDAQVLDRVVRRRRPAVSASSTGQPPSAVWKATTSRVVPGSAVDDRAAKTAECVEQAALPHVGTPGDDHLPSGKQPQPERPRSMSASRPARAAAGVRLDQIGQPQRSPPARRLGPGRARSRPSAPSGLGKVVECLRGRARRPEGNRTPEAPIFRRACRRRLARASFQHQLHRRCTTVTLNLDGRNVGFEHDGDHFVSQPGAHAAQPQPPGKLSSSGIAPFGRKPAPAASMHPCPQTRTTAMAPRPAAVSTLKKATPDAPGSALASRSRQHGASSMNQAIDAHRLELITQSK